jgi:hypothetical protein
MFTPADNRGSGTVNFFFFDTFKLSKISSQSTIALRLSTNFLEPACYILMNREGIFTK